MSYSVKPGDIFGRIGSELGKGLSEQIPKEVERNRLSSGLKKFEQESQGLNPMQSLSRLASIPGALEHPELVRQFGELAKQQGQANALNQRRGEMERPEPSPFPQRKQNTNASEVPSITTERPIQETVENYIPPTYEEKLERAGELYTANPALYKNDPQNALQAVEDEVNQNSAINQAYQQRRTNEQEVQDNVVNRLRKHSETLGVDIPPDIYSDIENEAIKATKPKSQGGKGLTEQQSMKEYGEKLDDISRRYKSIETLGKKGMLARSPKENKRSINSLQQEFKKNDDQENFAKQLINKNSLSPGKAYYLSYPTSDYKELNNSISKIKPYKHVAGTQDIEKIQNESRQISEKLAPLLKGGQGSPLALAEELKALGYDPDVFMDYVTKNKNKLGLDLRQGRELDQPRNFYGTLNDWWLFSFSGLDKLLEQE